MNKLIFVMVLSSILISCTKKPFLFTSKKDKLEIIDPSFEFLSSKAKFKFDHNDKKVSATANFRIQKDSVIWISITPGLGLEVARVLINRDKVLVLDKLNRNYHDYRFEELSEQYGFEFSFDFIQSVILGSVSVPYTNEKIDKTSSHYAFEVKKGDFLIQNFIGTHSMKLEKVSVTDDSSKNTISVNYGNFVLVDKEVFPNDIKAVINYGSEKKPNTEIDISYNKLTIEKIPLAFPFSVPSKYGRK